MNLVIKGKNMDVPKSAMDYVEKKIDKFDRHLKNITEAKVELSSEKTRSKEDQYVVEMTIDHQGTFLRAEERAGDIFSAVDSVADMMDRQIRRYKERLLKRKTRPAMAKGEAVVSGPRGDDEDIFITKVKRFPIQPMSVDEAIDQMDLLGHSFFVFFSNINEQVNVVYRRNDNTYGLIEPEMTW